MRLLDLYSGAGGSAKGYQRAGFYVVGVDIKPQPHYCGDEFHLADALEYCAGHGREFDVIHASPICKPFTKLRRIWGQEYPNQIIPIREALRQTGKPYIIENVPGAPLINPLMLCGTMFGLKILRHRLFEINPPLWFPPLACCHNTGGIPKAGRGISPLGFISIAGHIKNTGYALEVMGIDWMAREELSQAIPPKYTEWIGKQLLVVLQKERVA